MSRPGDDAAALALAAALGAGRAPRGRTREERVAAIGRFAKKHLDPSDPDSLLVCGALLAWLEKGGNLVKDYLKVSKPQSRRTASAIWREQNPHHDESEDDSVDPNIPSGTSTKEGTE